MSARDDYARAIRLLIDMRDRAEMAARPPGERVEYTRQDHDQHLDDMSVLGRLTPLRAIAGRRSCCPADATRKTADSSRRTSG